MQARGRLPIVAPLLGSALLAAWGCQTQTELELQRKVEHLNRRVEEQDNQLVAQQVTIEQLHEQLRKTRGWTEKDFEIIYTPVKVEIAGLSGGDDYDGRPGDDGVTVYLKPIDRDGDALKVAGDIRIELYDLQNPPGENRIGVYTVPVDRVHELWYGKLATYHYTVRCPWQQGPPKHDEITIRATFVDYLTQRVMTAQTVCKVNLAPRETSRD